MKDTITDANFPRTAEGRVYHLGLARGELADRVLTVGDPSRARTLSQHFDGDSGDLLEVASERGFLTFTGTYKGVPMSIVAIGMGFANMDFFIREGRECANGDMFIIRFGSCGCLTDLPVGSIVVPEASVAVTRNLDFDFQSTVTPASVHDAYLISRLASADPGLHSMLLKVMTEAKPASAPGRVVGDCVNASADSFYSSQGRITKFPDHNAGLIEHLLDKVDKMTTLEMETFYLLHLASVYRHPAASSPQTTTTIPPTRLAVMSTVLPITPSPVINAPATGGRIYACSAQMVFASRLTNEFITPDAVTNTQAWAGLACLEALSRI